MAHDGSYKCPRFDGVNYTFWKVSMEGHLNCLGFGVWKSIKDGCIALDTPPTDLAKIRMNKKNSKAKNAIMCGLVDSRLLKVTSCSFARDVWEKLRNIYEGDNKVNKAKIKIFKSIFETLRMK